MLNQIITCDCIDGMASLPAGCVDLVVTSPPYDNLRDFDGWASRFEFKVIAKGIRRVVRPDGGTVLWQVQNQIVDGAESCTSELQKLYFRTLGFKPYHSIGLTVDQVFSKGGYRYGSALQYVHVFCLGNKPRVFNAIWDLPTKTPGAKTNWAKRDRSGSFKQRYDSITGTHKSRGNVWCYNTGCNKNGTDYEHPAVMHIDLARDLIKSYSNPGGVVLDPMCGEGTVCLAAKELGRNYIGMEISPYFAELARKRLTKGGEQ